jgi:amidase
VIEELLARIEEHDRELHSVIAVDPSAPDQERALRAEAADRGRRGPLHGLAVLVKDNIDATGLATTAGSFLLAGNRPTTDAPAVARLREAGAVVLGKTNLSEWANFRSTRSASGWSAVGGLTANPYRLDRSAGGSSSGSAAAVAAGFAPVALGTETDGSILCPASLCGCVGVKPTVGLTSRQGVVPISPSQDTVGPIARTVRIAAAVLDAIAEDGERNHLAAVAAGVSGLRVGVPRSVAWGRRREIDALAEEALSALSAGGARIVDAVQLAAPDGLGADEMSVLLHEFHAAIDSYFAGRPGTAPADLAEAVKLNDAHPLELEHFGQELFEQALATPGLGDTGYLAARDRCRRAGREDGIDAALSRHGVDVLLAPSFPPAWKADLVDGDPGGLYSAAQLPAVAGYPAVTVPVGLVAGLPVGVTAFGAARSEPLLLRVAAAVEAALGPCPPPTFAPPRAG